MQDVFYEESTTISNEKRETFKYRLASIGSILSFFIAIIWTILDVYFLDLSNVLGIIFGVLPIAVFIVLGVFLKRLKDKFSIVYDYTFITGSIRICRVIRNSKRKSVIEFECSDIEKIGKTTTDLFYSYYAQINKGIDYIVATTNDKPCENKNFYYVVVNVMSQKTLIKIECTREFIINIIKFSKRTIIDGELLK